MPKAALEVVVDYAALDEARSRLLSGYARAIANAPEPECEATGGWWAINERTGRAAPRSCKKWSCEACRSFKRLAVLVALQHGLSTFAARGHAVHALTLTDGDGGLDFATFYAAWDGRIRQWLKRHGYMHAYASALEVQPNSGRLHSHALLVAPLGKSGFVPHADLMRICERAGLGFAFIQHITDIPPVSPTLAGYFVKGAAGEFSIPTRQAGEIGSYMAKAKEMELLAGFAATRLRPFRVSQNWTLKLRQAQEQLREELYGEKEAGEWVVVHEETVSRWLVPFREEREREVSWRRVGELETLLAVAA
jgi:hypothetical protein